MQFSRFVFRFIAVFLTAGWGYAVSAQASADPLTIYTHGDTNLALFKNETGYQGAAIDTLKCIMTTLDMPYSIKPAPLSRATQIMNESTGRNIWFPTGESSDTEKMARMVGPVGDLKIYWFMLKDNPLNPFEQGFKENALVSTYTGSLYSKVLVDQGYNYVESSADHNRIASMLLMRRFDAVRSIDFTNVLADSVRERFQEKAVMHLVNSLPVYFQFSKWFKKADPEFYDAFNTAYSSC